MSDKSTHITNDFLLFEGFFDYLQLNGFIMGVDQHLRVRTLLNKLPEEVERNQLRLLLAPLFARDEEKQALFYEVFDRYFDAILKSQAPTFSTASETDEIETPEPPDNRKMIWYSLLALVLVIAGLLLVKSLIPEPVTDQPKDPEDNPQDTVITVDAPVDSSNTAIDSVVVAEVQRSLDQPEYPITLNLRPPLPENIDDLEYLPGWWERNRTLVLSAGLLFFFLLFLIYRNWKNQRRKYLLTQQQLKRPPDTHPLTVPQHRQRVFEGDDFFLSARRLREREISDIKDLDIDKTIKETVDAGGLPTVAFRSLTQPSEYLVLIDQANAQDHQAGWMRQLMQELHQQEVFLEIYYYKQDPRICWKYHPGNWVYLEDLYFQTYNRRLLIFGDGSYLFNGLTGDLSEWAEVFEPWDRRALMTPVNVDDWSRRELHLSRLFHVLPATPNGLAALNASLRQKLDGRENISALRERQPLGIPLDIPNLDREPDIPGETEQLLTELRSYLGNTGYRWLCALAAYPELHWDFTLEMGRKLDLTNFADLYKLSQLQWFQSGNIPEEFRQALLEDAEPIDRKIALATIVEVLEFNPPVKDTYAYHQYRLNLAMTKLQLTEDKGEQKALKKEVREITEADPEAREYVGLKYRPQVQAMSVNLPSFLQKMFFKEGASFLGTKTTGMRTALALLILGLALVYWFRPKPEITWWQDRGFELTTARDSARYYTYKANRYVALRFAIEDVERAIQLDSQFVKPYYNKGHILYEMDSLVSAQGAYFTTFFLTERIIEGYPQGFLDSVGHNAWWNAGVLAYKLASFDAVRTAADQLMEDRPEEALYPYFKGLGYMYEEASLLDSALLMFNTAYEINPGFFAAGTNHPVVRPLVKRYARTTNFNTQRSIQTFLEKLGVGFEAIQDPDLLPQAPEQQDASGDQQPIIDEGTVIDDVRELEVPQNTLNRDEIAKKYRFDQVRDFQNGRAAVRRDNLWGFINANYELVIPLRFYDVTDFRDGDAQVQDETGIYYINRYGQCTRDCPESGD